MRRLNLFSAIIACAALAVFTASAGAGVLGVTIADASSGDYTLTSVSVDRSGGGVFTYTPDQLTNVTLTDVAAFATPLLVPGLNASEPLPGTRASLLEDWRLDSGVIEPFSIAGSTLESFEVTFTKPVINSAGEDILVFDVGGLESTFFFINNDDSQAENESSPQRLQTNEFATNLLNVNYSLFSYNNDGDRNVDTLAELESPIGYAFSSNGDGVGVSAAGLDLSRFGVPLGGSISSIRFQAVTGRIDPVLIVGLPVVPEPAGLSLIAFAALGLLRRRTSTGA